MNEQKIPCACGCGELRARFDAKGRERRFIDGHAGRGRRHSTETRALLSGLMTGRTVPREIVERRAASIRGPKNGRWKGGRYVEASGYVCIRTPHDLRAHAGGYIYEHILVYEAAHGPIPKGMIIHHKNGKCDDNRLENLEMVTQSEHRMRHIAAGR